MQTVVLGEEITFYRQYYDGDQDPYDPPDVSFTVVKNASNVVNGPFSYSGGDIIKLGTGSYTYSWTTSLFATPAVYQVRWEAEVEGDQTVFFEAFQIVDPPVESIELTDAPRLYGKIVESPLYRVLGIGLTDRLCLIGHANGLGINNPYQIANMQEAINALGGSADTPLLKALLEAYNVGAKDIWLVAAAPESEYVPFDSFNPDSRLEPHPEWGGLNFYERYAERLETTYTVLREYDFPEIIVPVEASFTRTGGVDFLTPLVEHCMDAFEETSAPRIGILGTRFGDVTPEVIEEMVEDPRLGDFGSAGKFTMIVAGEGVFNLPQTPTSHTSPVAAVAAGTLATNRLDAGLTYQRLKNVLAPFSRNLTKQETAALSAARINPLITTPRGRRGSIYESILATDNTLSDEGSDYWSIVQMRLVSKLVNQIRAMGSQVIGTIDFMQLKMRISDYLQELVETNYIRDYSLLIERDNVDRHKATCEVSVKPYFGVRELFFQVTIGPGA